MSDMSDGKGDHVYPLLGLAPGKRFLYGLHVGVIRKGRSMVEVLDGCATFAYCWSLIKTEEVCRDDMVRLSQESYMDSWA